MLNKKQIALLATAASAVWFGLASLKILDIAKDTIHNLNEADEHERWKEKNQVMTETIIKLDDRMPDNVHFWPQTMPQECSE